jgi:hypothetical protein
VRVHATVRVIASPCDVAIPRSSGTVKSRYDDVKLRPTGRSGCSTPVRPAVAFGVRGYRAGDKFDDDTRRSDAQNGTRIGAVLAPCFTSIFDCARARASTRSEGYDEQLKCDTPPSPSKCGDRF